MSYCNLSGRHSLSCWLFKQMQSRRRSEPAITDKPRRFSDSQSSSASHLELSPRSSGPPLVRNKSSHETRGQRMHARRKSDSGSSSDKDRRHRECFLARSSSTSQVDEPSCQPQTREPRVSKATMQRKNVRRSSSQSLAEALKLCQQHDCNRCSMKL